MSGLSNVLKKLRSLDLSHYSQRIFPAAEPDPLDFSPAIIRLQDKPPAPLGSIVLKGGVLLFCLLLLWALFGRLDIVAVAEGKLVPQTYLKIVQPAEQGIIREILVREGQRVAKGQVLVRMDRTLADAEGKAVTAEYYRLRLTVRRIDAELAGVALRPEPGDPPELLAQVSAQYNANRRSYESAVDEQQSAMEKAAQDLAAAREIKVKLEQVLPHYREQEMAFTELSRTGDIARLTAEDKRRERIEREQDLRSQEHIIRSSGAVMAQARKRLQQLTADYRQQLQTERIARAGELAQITQELAKQEHRQGLQELRAPQSGVVKDLATHTAGTVVSPGTILMTLVPNHEALCAEVWVANDDIGFIRPGQQVKVKISSFTFQKYGMLDGEVLQVSADASDGGNGGAAERRDTTGGSEKGLAYKTLVKLSRQQLLSEGISRPLAPGMQVAAEIKLGTRTVLEYLFSPVTKAFHEAGRER